MNILETNWNQYKVRADEALNNALPVANAPPVRLHEAMRYATTNGGKRVRAVLVYLTGEMFGAGAADLDAGAAAVELIHAYSLVHDDLPSMDDDDMRRGAPSCHKAYDEPTAILVGDALQALAFEVLAHTPNGHGAERRAKMIQVLASASGSSGMVGGQIMDIAMANGNEPGYDFDQMHLLKTAALINSAVQLGAVASGCASESDLEALKRYGNNIGLAFQCVDDALDGENPEISSKSKALQLHKAALAALDELNMDTQNLRHLADFVVERTH